MSPYPRTGLGLGLFVVTAFGGVWVAYDPLLSWPMLLMLLGSVGLFLAIALTVIPPQRVAIGLVIIAGLLAFYFVGQYAHLDYRDEIGLSARLGRVTGSQLPALVFFTPHPNAVAGFLEGAFFFSLVLTRQAGGYKRWGWGCGLALITYGLFVTGSRGAWSGLAVATGLWVLLRFQKWDSKLVSFGVGIGVSLLLGLSLFLQLGLSAQSIPLLNSTLGTGHSRLTLYRNSLALLKDYPFTGIGLGNTFAMIYSQYQLLINVPYLYYAHNLFLSVGLGQGIIGLVALVWLLVDFYGFVLRVERVSLERSRLLFRAAWLGTTAILVHGLVDSVQFSGDYWTMLMPFAMAGLAIALGRAALRRTDQNNVAKQSNKKSYLWKRVGSAAIITGITLIGVLAWPTIMGAWYANLGAIYQTWADLSPNLNETTRDSYTAQAMAHFEQALQWSPVQPAANRRLGMMALDRQDFEEAITYLKRAYAQEPHNQATLKALGYAYLWTGQLDSAQMLFQQVEFQSRLVGELRYWHGWWGRHGREDLSAYAGEVARRLSDEERNNRETTDP